MKIINYIFAIFVASFISCNQEDYKSGEVTFNPEEQKDAEGSQGLTNFAAGKFYKSDIDPIEKYKDIYPVTPWSMGTKLTDGEISTGSKDLVVSWGSQTVNIVVDLGSVRTIKEVAVHAVSDNLYNIKLPAMVKVAYSIDNKSWMDDVNPGTFTPKDKIEQVWLNLPVNSAKCRYVKVTLEPRNSVSLAIDEIKVMGEHKNENKYVPKDGCYNGAFCPLYAYDPEDRKGETDDCAVSLFEENIGKQLSIMLWYQKMTEGRVFAEMKKARENFWGKNYNGKYRIFLYGWANEDKEADAEVTLISQGEMDEFFKSYFAEVAEQDVKDLGPIWFRPMNEMNGSWMYPYFHKTKEYVRAWRRMYNIAEQLGVTEYNVFVWSPACFNSRRDLKNLMEDYYPGDIYVDWLGVSLYPPSLGLAGDEEKRYPLYLMEGISSVSKDKPIMISEGAYSSTCNRERWIREWFELKSNPRVKAVIWENHTNTSTDDDRRLHTDKKSLEQYRELVKDPYWLDAIPAEIEAEMARRKN